MIGLTGAHRTGKTTLAQAYAAKHDIPFVKTSASAVFTKLGADPRIDYPFRERLAIQVAILEHLSDTLRQAGVVFVTDRTPLDALAYTLADVQRETLDDLSAAHLDQYITDCIRCTNSHFTTLVLVQPGIKLVEAPGKAPARSGYVEHISQIIMGLINDERVEPHHYYLKRTMTDMERRIAAVEWAVGRTAEKQQHARSALEEQGVYFH